MEKQDVPYKIISNLKSTFVIPSRLEGDQPRYFLFKCCSDGSGRSDWLDTLDSRNRESWSVKIL